MKKIVLQLLLIFGLGLGESVAQATFQYSVKAFLPRFKGASVELVVDGKLLHRSTLQEDVFSYNGVDSVVRPATFSVRTGSRIYTTPVFIERGTIKVRDFRQQLVGWGTPLNDTYSDQRRGLDSTVLAQPGLLTKDVRASLRRLAAPGIRSQPASLVSLQWIKDLYYRDAAASDTSFYTLLTGLSPALHDFDLYKSLEKEAAERWATAVGRPAPTSLWEETSSYGSKTNFTGGYTLIQFWASWCAPCRREMPALKAVVTSMDTAVLTLHTVSLDTREGDWRKALNTMNLPGKHSRDALGWNGKLAQDWGVKALPMNFLVDARGTIVARNLSPEGLRQFFAEGRRPVF